MDELPTDLAAQVLLAHRKTAAKILDSFQSNTQMATAVRGAPRPKRRRPGDPKRGQRRPAQGLAHPAQGLAHPAQPRAAAQALAQAASARAMSPPYATEASTAV